MYLSVALSLSVNFYMINLVYYAKSDLFRLSSTDKHVLIMTVFKGVNYNFKKGKQND